MRHSKKSLSFSFCVSFFLRCQGVSEGMRVPYMQRHVDRLQSAGTFPKGDETEVQEI